MPHTAPGSPAEARYTDTDLEPVRDALAALANGDFRTRAGGSVTAATAPCWRTSGP